MSAIQLPMMLSKLSYILDNPWNVSLDRAWSAGLVLADTLRRKKLGVRPITLVGFSLGARLIYSCLLDLAKTGDYGLVQNVYLFGAPCVVKDDQIALARSVISGRFVNGYSKKDWILGYLFRATAGGLSTVAGLSPINQVENFNCSEYVQGHMEYRTMMPKLLKLLDWEVLSEEFVEINEPDPEQIERERKLISEFEEAAAQDKLRQQKNQKRKSWIPPLGGWFGKSKNKEWWEMYEEGQVEESKAGAESDASSENSGTSNKESLKGFKLRSREPSRTATPTTPHFQTNEDQFAYDLKTESTDSLPPLVLGQSPRSTPRHSPMPSRNPSRAGSIASSGGSSHSAHSATSRKGLGGIDFHVVGSPPPPEGMKPFRLASLASPGSGSSINNKKKSPTPSPRTPSFKINIMKGKRYNDCQYCIG
ncbi:unnamed protein product [Ambrosiozyma monospora]|uniref:Unnamed protein product n=1 Tax=Ambrosiozyma monospora TaxID=43982 RepID=A0A9W6Z834_AMBMO|nr:unnamed protein product [Ambrosiozyma monospora]